VGFARNGRFEPTPFAQGFDQAHAFFVDGFTRFIMPMQIGKLFGSPPLQTGFEISV
jgi:hypothetical protein